MSAFLESQTTRPTMSEDKKRAAQEVEINSLVRAKGFNPGRYTFRGDSKIMNRRDGSITSGKVLGTFTASNIPEELIFDKNDFNDELWHKICSIMGFKYHNHSDITKFTVSPKEIKVDVEIATPEKEY